jgi:hypothetical protein
MDYEKNCHFLYTSLDEILPVSMPLSMKAKLVIKISLFRSNKFQSMCVELGNEIFFDNGRFQQTVILVTYSSELGCWYERIMYLWQQLLSEKSDLNL